MFMLFNPDLQFIYSHFRLPYVLDYGQTIVPCQREDVGTSQ